MLPRARWIMLPAILVGWLVLGSPAQAAVPEVKDEAHFFKPETIRKANAVIQEIHDRFGKDLVIETYQTPPGGEAKADEVRKMSRKAREDFFSNWLKEKARAERVNGVHVLICRKPGHVEVGAGQATTEKAFTQANEDQLRKILFNHLEAKDPDGGLLEGVNYVRDTMQAHLGSTAVGGRTTAGHAPKAGTETTTHHGNEAVPSPGINWVAWICFGLVALVVIWVVIGLIRMFTGAGRSYADGPGGGYGRGGYAGGGGGYGGGYGGGGGGGGFLSGLFGGMLGGVAGSWMYDRFFRGDSGASHSGSWGSSSAYGAGGDVNPTAEPAASDEGRDFQTTGSDFGEGAGGDAGGQDFDGGDADAGGGDFGGGDAGGGDFGGGDFGGGGFGGGDAGGGDAGGGDF